MLNSNRQPPLSCDQERAQKCSACIRVWIIVALASSPWKPARRLLRCSAFGCIGNPYDSTACRLPRFKTTFSGDNPVKDLTFRLLRLKGEARLELPVCEAERAAPSLSDGARCRPTRRTRPGGIHNHRFAPP